MWTRPSFCHGAEGASCGARPAGARGKCSRADLEQVKYKAGTALHAVRQNLARSEKSWKICLWFKPKLWNQKKLVKLCQFCELPTRAVQHNLPLSLSLKHRLQQVLPSTQARPHLHLGRLLQSYESHCWDHQPGPSWLWRRYNFHAFICRLPIAKPQHNLSHLFRIDALQSSGRRASSASAQSNSFTRYRWRTSVPAIQVERHIVSRILG